MKNVKQQSSISLATLLFFGFTVLFTACNNSSDKSEKSELKEPSMTIQEAAFLGNEKGIKEHIDFKSDLNQKDTYGSTPLHIAATFGKNETAILLIEGGADINAINGDGSTALHVASFFCRKDIVRALLDKNADVTIQNSYKSTALEVLSPSFETVKPVYDQLSKDLGPLGLKLDYDKIEEMRPIIAEMIKAKS